MPLDARKVAHTVANRAKIRAGRSETVVLVIQVGASTSYQAVGDCVWHQSGDVPPGIANRVGEITRTPWDALLEVPAEAGWPDDVRVVARTPTATANAVAAAPRYTVLDARRQGLAPAGSRWLIRLRKLR